MSQHQTGTSPLVTITLGPLCLWCHMNQIYIALQPRKKNKPVCSGEVDRFMTHWFPCFTSSRCHNDFKHNGVHVTSKVKKYTAVIPSSVVQLWRYDVLWAVFNTEWDSNGGQWFSPFYFKRYKTTDWTLFCHAFNSWWPSDAIWQQGFRSTVVQVMACCLTAPSHYQNQCWLFIRKV